MAAVSTATALTEGRSVTEVKAKEEEQKTPVMAALVALFREQLHSLGQVTAMKARERSLADLELLGRHEATGSDHIKSGAAKGLGGALLGGGLRALGSTQSEMAAQIGGAIGDGATQIGSTYFDARLGGTNPGNTEAARSRAEVARSGERTTSDMIQATNQTAIQAIQRLAAAAA